MLGEFSLGEYALGEAAVSPEEGGEGVPFFMQYGTMNPPIDMG